jgi:hypothetical protein
VSNTYEAEITIASDTPSKRREICDQLDIALMTAGVRVSSGIWKVTLERVASPNLSVMKRAILKRLRGEFMGEAFARDFQKSSNRYGRIKGSALAFNARVEAALAELVAAGELTVEPGALDLYRLAVKP